MIQERGRAGIFIDKQTPDTKMIVCFAEQAESVIDVSHPQRALIIEVLKQDPRPAYKKAKADNKIYAMHLSDFNISWQVIDNIITVNTIELIKS